MSGAGASAGLLELRAQLNALEAAVASPREPSIAWWDVGHASRARSARQVARQLQAGEVRMQGLIQRLHGTEMRARDLVQEQLRELDMVQQMPSVLDEFNVAELLGQRNLVDEVRRSSRASRRKPKPPLVDASRFPTVVYRMEDMSVPSSADADNATESTGLTSTECSICLATFLEGQQLKRIPCSGSHIFHEDCCRRWFNDHGTCPLCRTQVLPLLPPPPKPRSSTAEGGPRSSSRTARHRHIAPVSGNGPREAR
eukprot:gnl/TRDRNA2_/TRDRNA2_83325_c0_seq3.p1 gnl/TRDRNA2_/TRDRNA2_83325_c0~~gnl/TRDRNA2_/TRDRNA2_83325_c0_seq3.p1  ORF type:complete len:256 (+),score=32.96 gnl/TRDRNA2_/TRDRNA2_83325_c0_seq3:110-877(+)